MSDSERPLGIKEIAAGLGCSTRTIRRYHAAGQMPTFKIGGKTSPIKMSRVDLRRIQKKRGK
ncbi:helix-turn-helix domain-containing protein [Shinella sp.]|uniref:helix-turn-helix domain-containing protein n=1 Tax=Shinella sp. TaxID=1870904 RepID=UPI0029BE38B0|nr:helix-turn-helix domain-containing protein [Shinella sp.]MDX3975801.1 helix-turn-helix domain-containing protein [Shinella sp.]